MVFKIKTIIMQYYFFINSKKIYKKNSNYTICCNINKRILIKIFGIYINIYYICI